MSTVARPGGRPCSAANASTPSATCARSRAATALPSITRAAIGRARLGDGAEGSAHERWRTGNNGSAMSRRMAAALVFLAVLVAAPAVAHARVLVGIGDQKSTMFTDPRFRWLGIRRARIVVSWNWHRSKSDLKWVAGSLAAARNSLVEPVVAFGHAWSGPHLTCLAVV